MKDKFFQGINWVLMVDLFFVLACFAWFAVALLGRSAGVPLGLEIWRSLWEPVMQPAIGIFMAGAILSGIASWVSKRLNQAGQ